MSRRYEIFKLNLKGGRSLWVVCARSLRDDMAYDEIARFRSQEAAEVYRDEVSVRHMKLAQGV